MYGSNGTAANTQSLTGLVEGREASGAAFSDPLTMLAPNKESEVPTASLQPSS